MRRSVKLLSFVNLLISIFGSPFSFQIPSKPGEDDCEGAAAAATLLL
jgi:hypothetical protein